MAVGMSSDSDQRDLIQRFIHRFHEEQRLPPPTRAESQEMESVLYSVSFGKQELFKKVTYQAFSAAISSQHHVDLVMRYICQKQKISVAKSKIVAYRVSSQNAIQSHRTFQSEEDEGEGTDRLIEGFNDGGEEGSGQKLLHLLQKMGVENILIIVCVWHTYMPGQFGTETFKQVLERAKDLLTSLHMKVLEAER